MKQESFSDMEYSSRKKKTKREEFLEIMDEIIPWDEWAGMIRRTYSPPPSAGGGMACGHCAPSGGRGCLR